MANQPTSVRTDLTTFILHWVLVAALVVSVLTGFRVAADPKETGISDAFIHLFDSLAFTQGAVTWLHVVSSVVLFAMTIGYIVFLLKARLAARIALAGRTAALGSTDKRTRRHAANVIIYWMAFALLISAGITGGLIYFAPGLLPYELLLTVHRVVAWAVLFYVLLHVLAQIWLGGVRQLLKIFAPRLAYGTAGLVAVGASAAAAAAVVAFDTATIRTLDVPRIETAQAPQLDGRVDDPAWQLAPPVRIHTVRGMNQPGGEVTVSVRAVHDGTNAYMLFEWDDPTRSMTHLPLIREAGGWRMIQTDYAVHDEDVFYEDKFGVMLSRSPTLSGDATAHLGPRPIGDRPGGASGRGLHYTTDGSIVDAWHWKAVRTGMSLGQIDDNHFGPPLEASAEQNAGRRRYTAGYDKDPGTGGGYIENWRRLDNGYVQPLHLPRSLDALRVMGTVELDPGVSDMGEWWLPIEATEPYSPEADARFPIGTIIPSVIANGPFQGDRGDISARAEWVDGRWHLEVSRRLDTGSPFDVPIANDTYLWVAAFNHSQTRHTQHLHPVRIELGD